MKRITVILTAFLVAFLMGGSWAWAGNDKPVQHVPVNICHATSSDTNPYVFITVDDDSAKFKGHLMHRNDPNKTWKSDGVYNGIPHVAGDPKADLIATYTDSEGVLHELDGVINNCDNSTPQPEDLVTVVDDTRLSCENGLESKTYTTVTPYAWDGEEWVLQIDKAVTTSGDWTFVRDLTKAELEEFGCENDPRPITTTLKQNKMDCDGVFLRTITVTTLDGEVISKEKSKWVKVDDLTKDEKTQLECLTPIDKPEPPKEPKTDKPDEPKQPELAATGANMAGLGIGATLIAVGAMLMFAKRRLTSI